MKTYDLSQDLNQEVTFWPYYPPFEVKYIKRKAEHGVNAQYIQTSNHMGTHLDAPRHFVTNGRTIEQWLPILESSQWLWVDRDAASPIARIDAIHRFQNDAELAAYRAGSPR